MNLDIDKLNVKVGFEIHQQLSTSSKLFCRCKGDGTNNEGYDFNFMRVLRPTKGELGDFDKAALFEYAKMNSIKYYSKVGYSCLVEADEEPPHEVSKDALETALLFSLALNSNIVDEIHVMRKLVIDGSNVCGFQRTMLISTGGYLSVDNFNKVGVQGICLEEDAAKLISTNPLLKEYGLDRLGIPLVEIALDPISGTPAEIVNVALTLGRLLRSSKRVTRGIGSIRQDVNISVNGGQVVEVKGVQQLSQLIKVLDYETKRQYGLIKIAEEFKNRNIDDSFIGDRIEDVTSLFSNSSSKGIKKILKDPDPVINCIRLRGLRGLIGYEPVKDVRLGKELGEFVRFFGLGGVFHSDELPNYGITINEIDSLKKSVDNSSEDAFIIIGGNREKINNLLEPLIKRVIQFKYGVIAETRSVTLDGTTIFSRPRPGSSRMYPETDIMPIPVDRNLLDSLKDKIPLPWNELIKGIMKKYGLNMKLSEQIFDSDYYNLFERLLITNSSLSPTFVASKLTEDIVSLSRNNLDKDLLTDEMILDIFNRLDKGFIAKESIILIFEKLMKKECMSVEEAINSLNLTKLDDIDLFSTLDKLFDDNLSVIKEKGPNSMGVLMGKSMAVLRGKVDGSKINDYLKHKLETFLNEGSASSSSSSSS